LERESEKIGERSGRTIEPRVLKTSRQRTK